MLQTAVERLRPALVAVALAATALGLVDPGPAAATPCDGRVVARVGPRVVTAREVCEAGERLPAREPGGDPIAGRRRRIEPLIHARLLVLEAEARGLEDGSLRWKLDRFERDSLVRELERVELGDSIAIDPGERARLELDLLERMKSELEYAVVDSVVDLFVARLRAWSAGGGTPSVGAAAALDPFGFAAAERDLAVFTYRGGRFTVGAYAGLVAGTGDPARISQRAERDRVRRDLDQYFRHFAYSEAARGRGYAARLGLERLVARERERILLERLEAEERALGGDEEERFEALIAGLKAKYPIVVDERILSELDP